MVAVVAMVAWLPVMTCACAIAIAGGLDYFCTDLQAMAAQEEVVAGQMHVLASCEQLS